RLDHWNHSMNVKRFSAKTSRDALVLVRQSLGDDAVVLSTKPCPEGIEVLAMAGDVQHIERIAAPAPAPRAAMAKSAAATRGPILPTDEVQAVQQDVEQLAMSTLSFQDYVRERMLKRREAALKAEAGAAPPQRIEPEMNPVQAKPTARIRAPAAPARTAPVTPRARAAAPPTAPRDPP